MIAIHTLFKWFEEGNPSYDMEELLQEFAALQTLEEYLIINNYADKIREVKANPPATQERRWDGCTLT